MKQYKTRKLMILFAILILVMVLFLSVMAHDAGLPAGEVALQAELQNTRHITVLPSEPTNKSTLTGKLEKLDLTTIFQDT